MHPVAYGHDTCLENIIAWSLYCTFLLTFSTSSLVALNAISSMGSRYWDEIDWYIKEGTDKLCEILSIGSEDGKLKEDENVSQENEEETDKTEDETSQSDNESTSENEVQSEGEDRPASLEEADGAMANSQVDELLKWCGSHKMFPPVYTYCDTLKDKEKLLSSTVQLGNGLSFQSSPHPTRDKAMEEAASLALRYLREGTGQQAPVVPQNVPSFRVPPVHPSMVVSFPSYLVNDLPVPGPYHYTQDGKVLPPRPYVISPNPGAIPFSVPPPPLPLPGVHPVMINNYPQVGPDCRMMYPRPPVHMLPFHPPQPLFPVAGPGVYTPPFISRAQPAYASGSTQHPHTSSAPDASNRMFVNNNPFIPSQVKLPYTSVPTIQPQSFPQSNAHIEATGSPNYILSDDPPAHVTANNLSTRAATAVTPSASSSRKPKVKLAISFGQPPK